MQQNSEAWLEWRGEGLGSSDAGIIMAASEYKTRYELWLDKTGRSAPQGEKFAFELGHRAEPIIRDRAEQRLDEIFEPACLRSKDYPFMQASLDGINLIGDTIIEIKLNRDNVHSLLDSKPEALPDAHLWQMQHQLIVSKAGRCLYVSAPYREDLEDLTPEDLIIMEIPAAIPMMTTLIEREGAFIELLATDTPPELVDRDGAQMRSATWRRNAGQWLALNAKISALKQQQSRAADRLKELSEGHPVARGYGVCVKNTLMKGNAQYKKIPELKDVDLDKYRGKSYIKSTVSGDE